MRRLVFI